MPQSERSQVIKRMLEWLIEHPRGVRISDLIQHVELEITDMGASTRTIKGYIDRCRRQKLLEIKGSKLVCTDKCKNWLETKVS